MGIKIITAPTTEPVSLADAKLHLRVDHSTEDTLIEALITAARDECEHLLGRAIAPQTLELSIDAFPDDGIPLPMPPVSSVLSIKYDNSDGDEITVDQNDYYLDDAQEPSWVLPAYNGAWPSARTQANAVRVQYIAGYSACPEPLRAWILLRVGSLYRWRSADSDKPAMPHGFVDRIIDRYRQWAL